MGNVCCGGTEERPKQSAISSGYSIDTGGSVDFLPPGTASGLPSSSTPQQTGAQSLDNNANSNGRLPSNATDNPGISDKAETSEEQARLEILVQTAGRAMVAVRSTRGSNPYYDQGFAAALSQHLEQTTNFPIQTPALPVAPLSSDDGGSAGGSTITIASTVYTRLAQPAWEDIVLGTHDGLAGCAGENPETYLDRVAESFLDQVVPQKGQLFTKVKPIVESLL
jgi:hypothetical protein